jgi:hypothetical protein
LSRRGRSLPANAGGFDTHRDSITTRCVVQVGGPFQLRDLPPPPTEEEAKDVNDEEEAEAAVMRCVVSGVSYSCLP